MDYYPEEEWYRVEYKDGDFEDLTKEDLLAVLVAEKTQHCLAPKVSQPRGLAKQPKLRSKKARRPLLSPCSLLIARCMVMRR